MQKIKLAHDYLIGFPSENQDQLEIKDANGNPIQLIKWGYDGLEYHNSQNTGIVLEAPESLYGPSVGVEPDENNPMELDRITWSCMTGEWDEKGEKELRWYEGAIPQGILPAGTLVITVPMWQRLQRRADPELEDFMNEQYGDYMYAVIPPTSVMAYCNASTGWEWRGYARYCMLENSRDTLHVEQKQGIQVVRDENDKHLVRKVIGPGISFQTGLKLRYGQLVVVERQTGVRTKINARFSGKNFESKEVTLAPVDWILATIKKSNMTKKEVLIPLYNYVLVKQEEGVGTVGDLILPDSSVKRPERGVVTAVGEDVKSRKVGDTVLFDKGHGREIADGVLMLRENFLFAVVEFQD